VSLSSENKTRLKAKHLNMVADLWSGKSIFRHARPNGQVIFSVSIDINYSDQKLAKETLTLAFQFRTNLSSV